ncbi:MAG: hypothetical protein R2713_19255 [Ilumatobacteraceae bacterium]
MRALPVVERPARSTRAEHRRGQAGARRTPHDPQVFYINIGGGGEPMVRRDFFEPAEYAIGRSA